MKGSCEVNVEAKTKFKTNAKFVLASIIVAMQMFVMGTGVGYSATSIPSINSVRNVPFRLTVNEQSWFGSIVMLAPIPGCFFSGILMDTYGRQLMLLILTIPTVIGWFIIIGAQTAFIAIVGRAVTGLTGGAAQPIVFAYASELVPPKFRGLLMSLLQLAFNAGILISYIVGDYIPWNWLAIACASTNCLAMCLLFLIPESPRWLLLKGNKEEGMDSLNWLRGSQTESEKELSEIQESLKNVSKPTPWMCYFKSPLWKFTLISQVLFIINELSGFNCIRLYTVTIFQMSGSELDSHMQTILVGSVAVLGSILFITFVDLFERRTVFIVSLFFSVMGLVTIGASAKAKSHSMAANELSFLPLVGLIIATLGYAFRGTGMISIITCEIFSTQARGRAMSIGYVTNYLSAFAVTKLFLLVSEEMGENIVFSFFAGVCLFGIIIAYFIIPKTKGLSMEEIQKNY